MSRTKSIVSAFIFGIAILGCLSVAQAQDDSSSQTAWYVGTIGDKSHVQMKLTLHPATEGQPGKITGSYFYETIGKPLQLTGTLRKEPNGGGDQANLEERDSNNSVTGTFTGTLDISGKNLSLTWSNPDSSRKLAVALTQIAPEARLSFTQGIVSSVLYSRPKFVVDSPLARLVDDQLHKEFASEFASDVKDTESAWAGTEDDRSTIYDRHIDMAYFSDSLISLKDESYFDQYTTAHHDMMHGRNFVLRKGKLYELKLRDLFSGQSDYVTRLSDACLAELRNKKAGFILDGSVSKLDANRLSYFLVGPQGITFLFSPYAVGTWAEGAYEVTVPWKSVNDILADTPEIRRWADPH